MIDVYVVYPATLNPQNAHKHAMRKEGQLVEDAFKEYKAWVDSKGKEAQRLQADYERQGGKGLAMTALTAFGNGAHSVMDNTSPAHRGFQEYKIPTKTVPTRNGPADVYDADKYARELSDHTLTESREPTEQEEVGTITALRDYFREVFGEAAYRRAVPNP